MKCFKITLPTGGNLCPCRGQIDFIILTLVCRRNAFFFLPVCGWDFIKTGLDKQTATRCLLYQDVILRMPDLWPAGNTADNLWLLCEKKDFRLRFDAKCEYKSSSTISWQKKSSDVMAENDLFSGFHFTITPS